MQYLKINGYDGLYSINLGCACKLEDLCSCRDFAEGNCKAGYLQPCERDDLPKDLNFNIGSMRIPLGVN